MDRTGNSPPNKEKGLRMGFLSLLRRAFLKLQRGKGAGNPPSGDEQPAPGGVQIFQDSNNITIGQMTVNNVAGNQIVYNNNWAEHQEAAELLRTLQRFQRRLPQAVGFSNANAVMITDALGETFTLPWSIVATYQDLHDALSKHFRGKVGEERVVEKRYCVARLNGTLVDGRDWSDALVGEELVMSMLVKREWGGLFGT
ncbi:hypothetical protein EST38_g11730 [Candolleomyces aberdarensis]|uniref:Ubiquitin-like domain-containing protein n=1 Tax=Candolleomyces aberdarensis TaxID=2316362 RepID=A0A4Q2D6F7_9AGAR|nr:hypothetical protein EST38_g11730 [Candolleomyces aberdarensis]